MSSAAKKAWATRRRKSPKKWRKRQKWVSRHSDAMCYVVRNGKVEALRESQVRGPQRIYYSTYEAEQVAKHGPKWFLEKKKKR